MGWQEGAMITLVLIGFGANEFIVAQQRSCCLELSARLGNKEGR